MICKLYAEVHNKLLKSIDTNKLTSYIIYLEAKNLYGPSVMQLLPTEILDWVNSKYFNLGNYSSDSPIPHSLKVALDYPNEIHDLRYDNLLAHAIIKVTEEILLKYQLQIIEDNSFSLSKNEKNLISNLSNKTKCKLHYQNLRLYSVLGLQLKEIHRILEFKQEPFLKLYMERNTDLRRETEKEGNKKQNANLKSNTTFGKSKENSIKKVDPKFVTSRKLYLKRLFRPNFNREKQFRNGAVAIKKEKCSINLNISNLYKNKHIRFK